jgi:hypothetical protein
MSFRESLLGLAIQPHESIVSHIDNKTFPLSENTFFDHNPDFLASEEYKRCLDIFEKRLKVKLGGDSLSFGSKGYNKALSLLMSTMSQIAVIESTHKDLLVEIAEKVVREMYQIPEEIEIQGFLEEPKKEEFDPSSAQEEDAEENWDKGEEPLSDEAKEKVEEEAQKRIILNSLSHGSSIHIWKSAYYLVKKELEEINPNLVELYDDYSALVSILLWMFPASLIESAIESGNQFNQGFNRVEWDSDDDEDDEESFDDEMEAEYKKFLEEQDDVSEEVDLPTGIAVGINFPVLLHEMNKCAFEILTMNSIPEDFSDEELMLYYALSDNYTEEIWHYYLGPKLWSSLLDVINKTDSSVAEVIGVFANLTYSELSKFCIKCVDDKENAIETLNLMIKFFEDK